MIDLLWIVLDLILAALLLGLGWAATATRDMQRAVVLFIAFGLLVTLVWARLSAPDLALAEAAIGAGIAGALLLAALRDYVGSNVEQAEPAASFVVVVNVGATLLFGLVAWGLLQALHVSDGVRLGMVAAEQIPNSGVSHPVTAVLLNFRAYDTLLELAVVLTAVLGIVALCPARPGFQPAPPLLQGVVRALVPLLIVTAGYLLWVGAHAPGGAFQAGATLAAAGILLRLGGDASGGLPGARATRVLLVAGVAVFVLVGLAVALGEGAVLDYPQSLAGVLILLIEAAATLSIAAALVLAYIGGRPDNWEQPTPGASRSGD